MNCDQLASRMLLFSPALAAAWLGKNAPGCSGSGFGAGRLVIPAISGPPARPRHTHGPGPGRLAVEIAAPVADLPPLPGQGAADARAVPRARFCRALRRCRSAITSAEAARNRGLAISPSLVVKNRATPTSTPTSRPAAGSGTGSVSAMTMTYQRRPSRLSCSAVTVPRTLRCWRTFTDPAAWKVRPRPATTGSRAPARAVTVDEPHLIEPAVRLEPGIAGLRPPGPGTVEEHPEHGVQPAQGLLLGGERMPSLPVRVGPAYLLQLRRLHAVGRHADPHAWRLLRARVYSRSVSDSCIARPSWGRVGTRGT